jgi:hypothetical protein
MLKHNRNCGLNRTNALFCNQILEINVCSLLTGLYLIDKPKQPEDRIRLEDNTHITEPYINVLPATFIRR